MPCDLSVTAVPPPARVTSRSFDNRTRFPTDAAVTLKLEFVVAAFTADTIAAVMSSRVRLESKKIGMLPTVGVPPAPTNSKVCDTPLLSMIVIVCPLLRSAPGPTTSSTGPVSKTLLRFVAVSKLDPRPTSLTEK